VKQSYNTGTTLMTSTCKYYQGSNLSITVSTPGTFVVTSSLVLYGSHTTGFSTLMITSLANASATCSPTSNNFVVTEEASGEVSTGYEFDVSLAQSFVVGAAGTYTFGVIGTATGGGASDFCDFYYASVVGVFYPS
jgi:hypothetical protein